MSDTKKTKNAKDAKNIKIVTEKLNSDKDKDKDKDKDIEKIETIELIENVDKKAITLGIIIVEKSGSLKQLTVKDYNESDLYKKCGFKKPDGFTKHTDWTVKIDGKKYNISSYGKIEGKANMENKYDFPPPIDTTLFFGSCALICSIKQDNKQILSSLSLELWAKMYEKLFGGFEDLATTCQADEDEEDELDQISASKKTKHGYLKDGFVIDSDGDDDVTNSSIDDSESMDEEISDDTSEDALIIEDIGSELSEEEYESESESESEEKE